uniref:Uncharacterized protein n=1 Tax=Anguilla anguilla TaxID=7936 RepID=A0A0E9WFX4_ANGAN
MTHSWGGGVWFEDSSKMAETANMTDFGVSWGNACCTLNLIKCLKTCHQKNYDEFTVMKLQLTNKRQTGKANETTTIAA